MKHCSECDRIVWPWQQSFIAFTPIHKKCHRELILDFIATSPPDVQREILMELKGELP